jgi:hypothetical protein
MQLNRLLLLLTLPLSLSAQKVRVEIPVSYTRPYCGGARPTEEMEKEAATPKPLIGATFIWLSEDGRSDSVRTDSEGKLHLKLKKGSYKIYEAWRYRLDTPNNLPIENFDKLCLRAEWEQSTFQVTVTKKKYDYRILQPIVKVCDWSLPCLQGEVPVPPGRQ